VCAPDSTGHTRPRLLDGKNTLNVVAVELLTRDGVDDGEFDTEEGKGSTTGLGWCNTSKRSDYV